MTKKVLWVLCVLFSIQLINSCRCPEPATYEITYNDVTVKPWNTSGFQPTEVEASVYKNAFGLSVLVNFEEKQIAQQIKSACGFNSAYAFSCDDDEYLFPDPIKSLEIWAADVKNNTSTNVTGSFRTYNYSDSLVTIQELFEIRAEWHDGFQFDLKEFDLIPDTCVFTVNVFLESGTKFSNTTQQVNFLIQE